MLRFVPLLLALLVLAGCDSLGDSAAGITGTWEGVVIDTDAPSQQYPVELRLRDSGQIVTGSGSVELPGETFEFSVVGGTALDGDIGLDLRFDQPPFKGGLDGRLTQTSPGRIQGTFQGRGEANGTIDIELVDR